MQIIDRRFIAGIAIVFSVGLRAQQVPNADFEEWTLIKGSGAYKDYEEPSGGVWSSGNGVIHVAAGADPILEKTTDAHRGTYAAKLTTRKVFGQIASGSLFTGTFKLNLAKPVESARLGVPFTAMPTSFRGWYKYAPAGNDSASLYVRLWRWNDTTKQRVLIAEAIRTQRGATDTWTEFNVPFAVLEPGSVPDTMAMVFSSSAGGGNFKGDEGSVLTVDDVSLSYDAVSVHDGWEGGKEAWCSIVSNAHDVQLSTASGAIERVIVSDLRGCSIFDRSYAQAVEVLVGHMSTGAYIITVTGVDDRGMPRRQTQIQPILP
jgi:hypothetical protein